MAQEERESEIIPQTTVSGTSLPESMYSLAGEAKRGVKREELALSG